MAGRIKIEPYKPLDVHTPAVPGGGYIRVDASTASPGKFGPSPLMKQVLEVAQGLPGFIQGVSEQLARDNEAAVKDADARMGGSEQALLFDPQTGYFNTQGEQALTKAPAVLETYGKAQEREVEALPNDTQRQMFEDLAQRRLETFSEQVQRHSTTERQRWYDDVGDRRIAMMQADAGFHWSDDTLLRRALGTTRAEVRDKAERRGWDSPLTEAVLRQQTSRTLVSAIEAAVERDPGRAQALRTRYDQHIEVPDRATLDALLTEAQTRQRVQAASMEILNATPPAAEQPTPQWRLRQAEAIPDPAVRAVVIRHVLSTAAAAEARARALAEQVLARVLKDDLTDPSQIPVREWVALDAECRQAIETRIDHNARGTEPAANPALVDQLATEMTQAPYVYARRDLVPSVAQLPLQQWRRFRDWQAGIRRSDPTTEDELYAIKRGLQFIDKMLPVDTTDNSATNYRAELVEEIDTWRRINGKSPGDAEIADMLRRVELPSESFHRVQTGAGRLPTRYGRPLTLQQQYRFDQYIQGLSRVQQYNPGHTEVQTRGWVPAPRDIARLNAQAADYARIHQFFEYRGISLRPRDYEMIRHQEMRGVSLPEIASAFSGGQANPAIRPNPSQYPQYAPGGASGSGLSASGRNRSPFEGEIVPGWQIVGRGDQPPHQARGTNYPPPGSALPRFPPTPRNTTGVRGTEDHHPFPQQFWNPNRGAPLPFSDAAKNVFGKMTMRVMSGHWDRDHKAYNSAIETAMHKYFRDNPRIKPHTMTAEQARDFYETVVTLNTDPVVQNHLSKMLKSWQRAMMIHSTPEN